jgi:hypothetical protein
LLFWQHHDVEAIFRHIDSAKREHIDLKTMRVVRKIPTETKPDGYKNLAVVAQPNLHCHQVLPFTRVAWWHNPIKSH